LQGVIDGAGLLAGLRVARIYDVQQQIGLLHLFERGAEGRDERGGQLLDEAHGIGDEDRGAAGQVYAADGGVEGGEELVGDVDFRTAEGIEQGGLARVGVAHERHGRQTAAPSLMTMPGAMGAHLFQLTLDLGDASADDAAIQFQPRLAGAAEAHTAGRAARASPGLLRVGAVGPRLREAGQAIFVLRQFHLQGAFARVGVQGEDVQNQAGAVQHFDFVAENGFELALMAGAELVVEDHHVRAELVHGAGNFLGLALAHEGRRVGLIQPLGGLADHFKAGGFGKAFELREGFGGAPGVFHVAPGGPAFPVYADQKSALWRAQSFFGDGFSTQIWPPMVRSHFARHAVESIITQKSNPTNASSKMRNA